MFQRQPKCASIEPLAQAKTRLTTDVVVHRDEVTALSRRDHKLLAPLPERSILPAAPDKELRVRVLLPAAVVSEFLRVRPILIAQITVRDILRIGGLPLVMPVPLHPVGLPLLQVVDGHLDRRDLGLGQGLLRDLVPCAAARGLLEVRLEIVRAAGRLHDGEGGGEDAVEGPEETLGGGGEDDGGIWIVAELLEGAVRRAAVRRAC